MNIKRQGRQLIFDVQFIIVILLFIVGWQFFCHKTKRKYKDQKNEAVMWDKTILKS